MDDLIQASTRLNPAFIQQKPPPAVAMANRRARLEFEPDDLYRGPEVNPRRREELRPIARPASRAGISSYEDQRPSSRAGLRTASYDPPAPQPQRPASRAGTNSQAFEVYSRPDRFDLGRPSRSPSLTSTTTMESMASISPNSLKKTGRCPHCKIHSWLPHSLGCPKKK
jgi:hypothetical protein